MARWPLVVALVAASWAAAACLVLGLVSFAQFPAELRSGPGGWSVILGRPVQFVVLGDGGVGGVESGVVGLGTGNVAVPSLVAVAATSLAALRWRGRAPRVVLRVALGLLVVSLLPELSALGSRAGGADGGGMVVVVHNLFRFHPARALLLAAGTGLVGVALATAPADRAAAEPGAEV